MTQQQQELTGAVMGSYFVVFGVLMLVTGRGPGPLPLGQRKIQLTPRVIRVIGAASALLGIALGVGSFAVSAGPPPGVHVSDDPWGGTAGRLFLAAWVVLACVIAVFNLKQMFKR